ncbi:hypothetical protein DCAR_0414494 [Daucus carota subsp. sativus]|uniref:Uncharacterized protein n=1 Tax=Daucus carota subsp. sativus TaxID=79200 RepID=A0AAF1ATW3_DAUCS|nr:hypothetical protein DCAR_0414494 [Daucus carota subsp. sativus]
MGACAKPFIFSLVLLLLISHSQQQMEVSPAPSPGACTERCKETKRPNLCKRACGSCCLKCNCVPPGTSGNYDACPCYFNLKTHNQIRKCP